MASGKRASMREGPLAQLFRKTEDEEAARRGAAARSPQQEPTAGRAREDRARAAAGDAPRAEPPGAGAPDAQRAASAVEQRATEAARRAEERAAPPRGGGAARPRLEPLRGRAHARGAPAPVFSSDIPENIMERPRAARRRPAASPSPTAALRHAVRQPTSPSPCCAWSASAAPA